MKRTIVILSAVFALISFQAFADTKTLEQRVADLEKSAPSLPAGMFVNGNIEMFYDPDTYDSDIDTRAEVFVGLQSEIDGPIDWAGAGTRFDSQYSLDTTLNNTLVEKQIGVGLGNTRLYVGETDAQRLGFAKTAKIGLPLIITEANSRIDHNEKIVLTFGGWENNNEFDFDEHRLSRDLPIGFTVGYDAEASTVYLGGTVSLAGFAELSYMQIGNKSNITDNELNQQGVALGSQVLRRYGIPVGFGVEVWDDKNTGLAKDDRVDFGVMYHYTKETMFTYHRVLNDDLGTDGTYLGVVHTVGPVETGFYYHTDVTNTSVWTGATTDRDDSIKATLKYKF